MTAAPAPGVHAPEQASSDSPPAVTTASEARVELMGMMLDPLSQGETVERIVSGASAGRGGVVVTANLDHLRRFQSPGRYRTIVETADLVVADGAPLLWASRVGGCPVPERVAGSDLVWSISEASAKADVGVFMLGGDPGTAERAGEVLCERYPGLRIAGADCPPFGFEKDEAYVEGLKTKLRRSGAGVVYVALGSPKQEFVIDDLRSTLPSAWWLGIGISFSFVCGDVQRAPRAVQVLGLEWVHRLAQEPQRLAKRYLVEGLPFAAGLFAHAMGRRLRGGRRRQSA